MQKPLITDAAGLAPYLRNVRRLGYHGYDWSADPPCHASSSGMASSFHFGDAEGGGVKIGCWAGCQGPGFVKRIEEALGIRLQVNVNGQLTHQSYRPGIRPSVRSPRPVAPKPPVLEYMVLPAIPAEGPITLEEWFAFPIWFGGAGNKGSRKHVATWQQNGETRTFRHSKPPEEGGVKLARYGGRLPDGQQVQPWDSFEAIEALIAETRELRESERRPCVSFAGDDDTHYPKPIGCVDADFKPDKDPDGIGAAFTAHVRQALIDAGCPMYSSTSGNGFHAIWRLEPWQDGKLRAPVNDGRRFRAWPSNATNLFHGARVEVFAPGDKRLVALWRYRPIANCEPGQVIPVLTYRKIEAILQAAREAARGEVPEPPVVKEAPAPELCRKSERPLTSTPVAQEPRAVVANCTLTDRPVSLLTLTATDCWIPATPQGPAGPWRHTIPEDQGGIRLARYGGESFQPWQSRLEVEREIERRHLDGASPALVLSGDTDCPSDLDLLLLTLDVEDTPLALAQRDRIVAALEGFRPAVFTRPAGPGRHFLARVGLEDMGREYPRVLADAEGCRLRVYAAGSQWGVVLFPDGEITGIGLDRGLPRIPLDVLAQVVKDSAAAPAGQDGKPEHIAAAQCPDGQPVETAPDQDPQFRGAEAQYQDLEVEQDQDLETGNLPPVGGAPNTGSMPLSCGSISEPDSRDVSGRPGDVDQGAEIPADLPAWKVRRVPGLISPGELPGDTDFLFKLLKLARCSTPSVSPVEYWHWMVAEVQRMIAAGAEHNPDDDADLMDRLMDWAGPDGSITDQPIVWHDLGVAISKDPLVVEHDRQNREFAARMIASGAPWGPNWRPN